MPKEIAKKKTNGANVGFGETLRSTAGIITATSHFSFKKNRILTPLS